MLAGLVDLAPPRARSPSGRRRRGARCRRSPRPAPRACRPGGSVSGETGAALTKSEPNAERLDRARGRGDRRRRRRRGACRSRARRRRARSGGRSGRSAAARSRESAATRRSAWTPRVFAIRAACIDCPTASVSAFAGRLLRRSLAIFPGGGQRRGETVCALLPRCRGAARGGQGTGRDGRLAGGPPRARTPGSEARMFTGIVTDIGTVEQLEDRGDLRVRIRSAYDPEGIAIGASIACDGICLTVVDRGPAEGGPDGGSWFEVDLSAETLARTNVRRNRTAWAPGTRVNLERALRLGDELGGHIVSGHVDGLAEIVGLRRRGRQHPLRLPRPGRPRALHRAQGLDRPERHLADRERGRRARPSGSTSSPTPAPTRPGAVPRPAISSTSRSTPSPATSRASTSSPAEAGS